MSVELIFFFIVAAAAVASALMMITRRNPMKSVLFLIVNFFCLAVLYLFLKAQFIAIIQILVYAGAIMVLFLFVIMLLNLGDESNLGEKRGFRRTAAIIAGVIVLVEIVIGMGLLWGSEQVRMSERAAEMGTVEFIGKTLYREYLFPFEVTSFLLLAAMVGVIVLAKKKFR
jgi:NADH-quinone oxidoreductase subunit J